MSSQSGHFQNISSPTLNSNFSCYLNLCGKLKKCAEQTIKPLKLGRKQFFQSPCWIAVLAAVVKMALGHKAPGICAFGKHTLKPIRFQGESHYKKPMRLDYVSGQVPVLQLHRRSGSLQVKSGVQVGSSQAAPALGPHIRPQRCPATGPKSDPATHFRLYLGLL